MQIKGYNTKQKNVIIEMLKQNKDRHLTADEMLKLCSQVAPTLFKNAGPACVNGTCTEGKMSCGHIKQVREYYINLKGNRNNAAE